MKEIKRWFRNLGKTKKEISNTPFRRELAYFFHSREWPYQTTITNVEAWELSDGSYEVMITTHKPGVLIGKCGSFINSIEEYFTQHFKRKVKVLITENQLWYKLYE